MHCIAYAFGNLRHPNVHSHEKPVSSLYLLIGDVVTS
jgi:hypothetical protein